MPGKRRNRPRSVGRGLREAGLFGRQVGNIERAPAHDRPTWPSVKWGSGLDRNRAIFAREGPKKSFIRSGWENGTGRRVFCVFRWHRGQKRPIQHHPRNDRQCLTAPVNRFTLFTVLQLAAIWGTFIFGDYGCETTYFHQPSGAGIQGALGTCREASYFPCLAWPAGCRRVPGTMPGP